MERRNSRKWEFTPLHAFLVKMFPDYVYKLDGQLAVPELANDVGMSREGMYKYLRTGTLTKSGATKLHNLAVKLAEKQGVQPPAKSEFAQFLLV
jgi:DNA-binding phage protein